jgi:hypothetical protein
MKEHGRVSRPSEADLATSRGGDGARLDELAATEARHRYRREGLSPIEPDSVIARSLTPGEMLFAVHRALLADSRAFPEASVPADGVPGDLYLTSARLVFVGGVVVAFDLDDIEEADLAGPHLLLVLRDGVGLRLGVDRPRLLRVQIAAARAATRATSGAASAADPARAEGPTDDAHPPRAGRTLPAGRRSGQTLSR